MDLQASELASKYRIERQLGQGGMGAVHLASDLRLGRQVAIKVLDPKYARTREQRERFLREARLVATLHNEHVVDIHDVGVLEDETLYIVMEYVSGETLRVHRGVPLEPRVAVDYALQACLALAEAHALGMIHRDIKLENMIRTTAGPLGPQIKLLDFGIAKAATTFSNASDSFITAENTVMGTPAYMSPEQARGEPHIDARTDIWSLGVVLHELIAGEPPFQGASAADLIAAVLTRAPQALPASVPRELRAAITRCLRVDPAERFQNVADLAAALAPFAGDPRAAEYTVLRCRNYLGLGAHVAHTFVSVAESPAARRAPSQLPRGTLSAAPAAAGDPWAALEAALPVELVASKPAILAILARTFRAAVAVSAGTVKLVNRDARTASYDWFAIFMGSEQQDAGVLGKRTFAAYVKPLRAYLAALDSRQPKVAIVISASAELGEGVRATISELRRELDTIVVPIWLREVERAHRFPRSVDLIEHRLHDLHARHNPFDTPTADPDPMRYVGTGALVNQILVALATRPRVISITALPGSGKSALVSLIQYSLPARELVVIRCGDVANTVADLARELFGELDGLAGRAPVALRVPAAPTAPPVPAAPGSVAPPAATPPPPTVPPPAASPPPPTAPPPAAAMPVALAAKLDAVHDSRLPRERLAETLSFVAAERIPIVVLEDADWFVAQVVAGVPEARELWVALGEVIARRRLDLLITSVRGGELERVAFGAWRNPVRPLAIAVPLLALPDLAYLVAELGSGAAVFSDAAVALLHARTRGHLGMVLALCSEAFRATREATATGPLDAVCIEAAHVANAARRLAAGQRPIGTMFDAVLNDDERHLLCALAGKPRRLGQIQDAVPGRASLGAALEGLEALGLVHHDGARYAATIPLLADWARAHVAPAPADAEGRWRRKTKRIAVGAALSAVIFAGYVVLLRNERDVTRATDARGCTSLVDFPTRASYGTAVTVYIDRACTPGPPGPAVAVRLVAYLSRASVEDAGSAAPACTAGYCSYEKRVVLKEQASSSYAFKVLVDDQEAATFSIVRDSLAGLKDALAQIMSLISVLPIALGIGLAFYTDLLKAIRAWWQRASAAPAA